MDRVRTRSKYAQLRRPAFIGAAALAMIGGGVVLANIDFTTQRVERSRLSIGVVQQGTMEIRIAANGLLLARRIEELAARVPGRVARADVKPGAVVSVGDLLVELTNPQLTAAAEEAHSAWEGAVAELRSAEAELEASLMNQEVVLTQLQFGAEKARAKADADEALARNGLISGIELRRSQLDLAQLDRTHELESARLKKLRGNLGVQLAVRRSRVAQFARALERARGQAADLRITAGISGIVQAIDVEIGQQLQPGSAIGRIAQQDQLYAELAVPAREATQVRTGQQVVVDTRNGVVEGVVARIDPGVNNGTVTVDVDLVGPVPRGARPQLQIEGTIYVARLPGSLYVAKPAFVRGDGTISVYKLDPAGRYATRAAVRTGRVSLHHVQILEGLRAGDRIITSETAPWQGQDRVLLD